MVMWCRTRGPRPPGGSQEAPSRCPQPPLLVAAGAQGGAAGRAQRAGEAPQQQGCAACLPAAQRLCPACCCLLVLSGALFRAGAASEQRQSVRATRPGAELKADRAAASKQQRNRRRAALFAQRRNRVPPHVAALLPLSHDVDVQRLWGGLLAACSDGDEHAAPGSSSRAADGMDVDADHSCAALAMTTLALAGRQRVRFTLLPPPAARTDPLAIVELGRSADCVLLAMPGDVGTEAIDDAGGMALSVLRSLGLPRVVALVQSPAASSGRNPLKDVAAAKKHAARALQEQVHSYAWRSWDTDTATLRGLLSSTP